MPAIVASRMIRYRNWSWPSCATGASGPVAGGWGSLPSVATRSTIQSLREGFAGEGCAGGSPRLRSGAVPPHHAPDDGSATPRRSGRQVQRTDPRAGIQSGGARRATRPRHGQGARSAGARGQAPRRPPRPGHRRAGGCPSAGPGRGHPPADDRPPGAGRRCSTGAPRAELTAVFDDLTIDDAEAVIRAFGLYFQLVNVAEERARVRGIRTRRRSARGAVTRGSIGEAIVRLDAEGADPADILAALSVQPVLTAHPTEARRRTTLIALRRVVTAHGAAARPASDTGGGSRRSPPSARGDHALVAHGRSAQPAADAARRGAQRAGVLRRHALQSPRRVSIGPSTLHSTCCARWPTIGRPATATGPARERRSCRRSSAWGSGSAATATATRNVTAVVTGQAVRIARDHVLRGYEAVCARLMQTVAAAVPGDRLDERLIARLMSDEEASPRPCACSGAFPDEPFRHAWAHGRAPAAHARGV